MIHRKEQSVFESEAWRTFAAEHSKRILVNWNEATGTPHRIQGIAIRVESPKDPKAAEKASRDVLNKYREVLGIDPAALHLVKADFNESAKEPGKGTWYIYYHQRHGDLPVYGGSVRLVIRGNMVTSMGSDFYAGIEVRPTPEYTLEEAIIAVRQGLGLRKLHPIKNFYLIPGPVLGRATFTRNFYF